MNKKNSVLIGLLIIQLAIIGYIYRPAQLETAPAEAFFSGFQSSEIKGLTITDSENKSIELVKNTKGWHLKEADIPADSDIVQKVLAKIIALESSRLVTRTRSSQVRLKVADGLFERKIDLHLNDDSSTTLYLGSSPSQKTIYFRKAGEKPVYLVKGISSWELQTDKESWWQSVYLDVSAAELSTIHITNSQGDLTFHKDGEKEWRLSGVESVGGPQDMTTFLNAIEKISIASYLGKEKPAGLGQSLAKIDYSGKKGSEVLEIWPKATEEDEYVVKSTNRVFYAKVRAYVLDEILKASKEDFFPPIVKATTE